MKENHESYGMIGISRRQNNFGMNLFGSSIEHKNTMMITIKRAEVTRDLNRNWYFGRKKLIEVELSSSQFAELITSLNIGDGVPCTLRYIDDGSDERIPDPPEISQRQVFEKEFQNDINKITGSVKKEYVNIKNILEQKGNIKVSDRINILSDITSIINTLTDRIPFLQKSFNEAMDKTVNEAKGEVEAFVMNRITSLGLESAKNKQLEITDVNYTKPEIE